MLVAPQCSLQPQNRAVANVVAAGNLGQHLALVAPLYRHVSPKGQIRPDGGKLLARKTSSAR